MKIAGGANRLGALVIGGSIRGLSIARSLGRHGVPVWVTAARGDRLATLSRYTRRTLPWITGSPEEQVGYLLRQARDHHLDGWALFPTVDRSAVGNNAHPSRWWSRAWRSRYPTCSSGLPVIQGRVRRVYRESVASRSPRAAVTQTGTPWRPRLLAMDNPRILPPMTSAPRRFAPPAIFMAIGGFCF